MAVTWISERYGNEADRDEETGSYTRLFWIYVDDPQNDREVTIINDPKVMNYLSGPFQAGSDTDNTVRVAGFRLTQQPEHKHLYEFELRYRSLTAEDDTGGGPGTDPFSEPPEIEYTWAGAKRAVQAVFEDALTDNSDLTPEQQHAIRVIGAINSAKEPFDPQPEIDDDRMVLTITLNQPNFNVLAALLYANSVNKFDFAGARAGQILMKPWRARAHQRAVNNVNVFYWRVTYEMHFRIEGWAIKLLDHGSYYYDGGYTNPAAPKKKFLDEDGHPTTGLLDGNGDKLPAGAQEKFVIGHPYHKTNFAAIGLPI